MAKLFQNKIAVKVLGTVAGKWLDFVRKVMWTIEPPDIPPETKALFDAEAPVIYALWHARMYSMMNGVPTERAAILISPSNDGEFIAEAARHMGFRELIRGSHKRGGTSAMWGMINMLSEKNKSVIFTVDGPRGPRYKVKPGVIKLCAQTQRPIIPMASSAQHMLKKFDDSWDHYHAASMFRNSIKLIYGAPIQVPADPDEGTIEQYCKILEDELMALNLKADAFHGFKNGERL